MADGDSIKINCKVYNRGKKTRQRDRPENIKVDLNQALKHLGAFHATTFENKLVKLGNAPNAKVKAAVADALNVAVFAAFCEKYPTLRKVCVAYLLVAPPPPAQKSPLPGDFLGCAYHG